MSAPAMYYSLTVLNSQVKTDNLFRCDTELITSVGNKTPTLQRCCFLFLFLFRSFAIITEVIIIVMTGSIVIDIIIIITIILVIMFIIISIIVQNWCAEKFG